MNHTSATKARLALAAGGSGGDGGGIRMTPALREAIRLLQLSRRELVDEIRREMASRVSTSANEK